MNAGMWFMAALCAMYAGATIAFAADKHWPMALYNLGALILTLGVIWAAR